MKNVLLKFFLMISLLSLLTACGFESKAEYESRIESEKESLENILEDDSSTYITVYLTIKCDKALNYPGLTVDLPEDGYMLQNKEIKVASQAKIIDVLENAYTLGLIVVDTKSSLSYGTYLIAINGLAEKTCGPESGWKYKVTGNDNPLSISSVSVKEGDEITFFYALRTNDKD